MTPTQWLGRMSQKDFWVTKIVWVFGLVLLKASDLHNLHLVAIYDVQPI